MSIYNLTGQVLEAVYGLDGEALQNAYTLDGEVIYPDGYTPKLTLLNSRPISELNTGITPQGFAIWGDYYFQFFTGDNKMRVFDLKTFDLISEYSAMNISHANSMQFGAEVQNTGFPLLYVSEWGASGEVDSKVIDVLKVSTSGYEKITSYTLPSSVGNHPSFIADWDNDIAYIVGYSGGTRDSEYMIISEFDIVDLTTPESQYQIPYTGVLNGFEYHNGKLIVYGNGWDQDTLKISFVDTQTHEVTEYTFPKTTNEEYEDCCVVDDVLYISNWLNTGGTVFYQIYAMNLGTNIFAKKTISILGDSISTYEGYIPSENLSYYTGINCGVSSVNQTWWKRLIDAFGMRLKLNNSWSGSRVSLTNGTESAGITRASNLGDNPNVIIVYMGINDFNNEVPLVDFRSAYETMIDRIKTTYPNAYVLCSTLPQCERNGEIGEPEINDAGVYLSEYNTVITETATLKNVEVLDFANCGITYANLSQYAGDWDSSTGKALHPNSAGHQLIANKAIIDMLQVN